MRRSDVEGYHLNVNKHSGISDYREVSEHGVLPMHWLGSNALLREIHMGFGSGRHRLQ